MIKKICFFTSGFAYNKQAMIDYLEKIIPGDIETFLFVPKKSKNLYRTTKIRIVSTKCSKLNPFQELRQFLRKNNIDLVINLGLLPYEAIALLYSSLLTKTEQIYLHLGNPVDMMAVKSPKIKVKSIFEAIVSSVLAFFPKKIILCSEDTAETCKKYLFFAREKIVYLEPTIPTDLFKPKNKFHARKKLKLNKNDKIIIFVGRIGFLKGSDILLKLIEKNPKIKFILVGVLLDDSFKNKKFHNLKLIESKSSQELVDYYNAADLCLFPSRVESFGLVPREAMACGVPAIVSDIKALKKITPAIKVPLDAEKINNEINNFFKLPEKAIKKLSSDSRKFVIQKNDDKIWENLYFYHILN